MASMAGMSALRSATSAGDAATFAPMPPATCVSASLGTVDFGAPTTESVASSSAGATEIAIAGVCDDL